MPLFRILYKELVYGHRLSLHPIGSTSFGSILLENAGILMLCRDAIEEVSLDLLHQVKESIYFSRLGSRCSSQPSFGNFHMSGWLASHCRKKQLVTHGHQYRV